MVIHIYLLPTVINPVLWNRNFAMSTLILIRAPSPPLHLPPAATSVLGPQRTVAPALYRHARPHAPLAQPLNFRLKSSQNLEK